MKKIVKAIILIAVISLGSCTDLDLQPKSSAVGEVVFKDTESYRYFLAKVYAGLAVTGQQGPAGQPDVSGDEGASSYLRQYWKAQELTTDEAVIGWSDGTLPTYHLHTWTPQNEFIRDMFNRIYFQITLANQFLRETSDAKLTSRGVSDEIKSEVKQYRAEARFLRALNYWHGLDLFGGMSLVTEENGVGSDAPGQVSREEIFNFVESELKAVESDLADPKETEYGRADKAAAWALLAKLYLNAETYIGQPKYNECIAYCNKVIDSNVYALDADYKNIFLADNENSSEIIFAVNFDGLHTQTYGGMTFLIHASVGGSMNTEEFGIDFGWGGLRTTGNFVDLFPDETGAADSRAMFFTEGQSKEIPNTPITSFNEGYAVTKYRNKTSSGATGSHLTFVDNDFPMFRLADIYLIYAEAVKRGGSGGSATNALLYINSLRQRAYGNTTGNISEAEFTLDFLIDERSRELYWEGHRRTDLIRFGLFTDNLSGNPRAIWPWKGDAVSGRETEPFRNLFPIPSSALIANPKLKQNEGY